MLVFPKKATPEQKVKLAAHLVPTKQQHEWQQAELVAFIHFGINTFTNKEWGSGKEDPSLFNPSELDAEQWVKTLKNAGFNMLILTAKHHDGFCLWPTATTQHSVASSPWKEGSGDVVKDVKEACNKYKMKFGIYLSPWDRNAPEYGNSPAYNKMFVDQLTELLTQYGEIHEVWFDGANGEGPNGKKQEYDWKRFYHVIDSLQPRAVKAIMGNDIRWVGNESGLGRETEWSATPLNPGINQEIKDEIKRLGISSESKDLGSRELIKKAHTLYWYPSEVDVSIRPGWFYHPEQDDQVKSLKQLVDIYYQSVGMNSVLLLNIPPDTRGLLHETDVERLKQFGSYINSSFNYNKATDKDIQWKASAGQSKEINIQSGETINTVMLQEDISKGQRVERFKVEGWIDNTWKPLTEGTTIGYKRLLSFDECMPEKLRVTILETRETANIMTISAHYAAPLTDSKNMVSLNDISTEKWNTINDNPLAIDLGSQYEFKGFTYNPSEDIEPVFSYKFYISDDGKKWKNIKKGEFSNIKNNPIAQFVRFDSSVKARFIQIESIRGVDNGKPSIKSSQIGILVK